MIKVFEYFYMRTLLIASIRRLVSSIHKVLQVYESTGLYGPVYVHVCVLFRSDCIDDRFRDI